MKNSDNNFCTHCGLIIPKGLYISCNQLHNNKPPQFCCYGCKAIYEIIYAQGLQEYYNRRPTIATNDNKKNVANSLKYLQENSKIPLPENLDFTNTLSPSALAQNQYLEFDDPTNQSRYLFLLNNDNKIADKQALIEIEGMTCSACGWLNEKYLSQKNGVTAVSVNMATNQMLVQFNPAEIKLSEILGAIHSLGYTPHSISADNRILQIKTMRTMIWKLFIAGFGAMQAMSFAAPLYFSSNDITEVEVQFLRWTTLLIITPVLFFSGRDYFIGSIRDLLNKRLSMDVPIALGLLLGYIHSAYNTWAGIGEHIYLDSIAMLLFFLLGGKLFELRANQRVTESLYNKLRFEAKTTTILINNEPQEIAVSALKADDILLIKHGLVIPADGVLCEGACAVAIDESMFTGETIPVDKHAGDLLNAGTVNRAEAFTMRVTTGGGDRGRVRQTIELLVAIALSTKPQFITFTLLIARWFLLAILILACGTFVSWYYFAGADYAIKITVALLVVTCPCALALATPLTISTLMAVLLNRGCILKNPAILEKAHKINNIVIDKTGTITKGKLKINKIGVSKNNQNWNKNLAILIAQNIEKTSEHPIAIAFQNYFLDKTNLNTDINIDEVKRFSSLGLYAKITLSPENEHLSGEWAIGSAQFCKITAEEIIKLHNDFQEADFSKTLVYLSHNNIYRNIKYHAVFVFDDEIYENCSEIINSWQRQNLAVNILSGDRLPAVSAIAQKLNINPQNYFAENSPEDKIAKVNEFKNQGNGVLMIGDGVNDAPVLALADISIGMPGASDLSKISADIILLKGNHSPWQRIGEILPILKQAKLILWQNYIWALFYNLIMIPIAILGFVNPWLAGLGMTISSLVVVFNSLRLFTINNKI